jgi:hypothetical protein
MNNIQVYKPEVPTYDYKYGPAIFNQNMAQGKAAGDQRWQEKQLDRAGLSRGGAQKQQAAIQGADATAKGIAQAYGQQTQDDSNIAGMAMQSQADQERMAQALAALQFQQQNQYLGLLSGLL